ncbi:hypothetical protein ACA910_013015 [Epithemia clementina (nom. ined.)]
MPQSYGSIGQSGGPGAGGGGGDGRGAATHHSNVPRRSPYGGGQGYSAQPSYEGAPQAPKAAGRPPSAAESQGTPGSNREYRAAPSSHGFPTTQVSTSESSWGQASQEPYSPSKHKPPSMLYHPPLQGGPSAHGESLHGGDGSHHLGSSNAASLQMQGMVGAASARAAPLSMSDMQGLKGYAPRGPMPQGQSPTPGSQAPKPPTKQQRPQSPSTQQQPPLVGMQQHQHHAARPVQPPQIPGGNMPFQQQQQQQGEQPAPPVVMRELRVEDALLYLDDVKREFRNQPGVYNEFLKIMKNFKTQAVDTPGVIQRVSRLFRGYNKLILGFNTFLPEGYKISLADLQRNEAQQLAEEAAEARRQEQLLAAQQQQEQQEQQQQQQEQQQQAMQIEQVRVQDIPQQPQQNFRKNGESPPPAQRAQAAKSSPRTIQPLRPATPEKVEPPPMDHKAAAIAPDTRDAAESTMKTHQPRVIRPKARPAQQKKQLQQPPQQMNPAVEFDHAISYVTQIKRRFANDPNTYHSFLDILHTYQKEQRGIKEVLEQVAHLFQDHPDLLKEFTFFLPDAVQEQAKERLHRAAAESESRLASQRQAQLDQFQKSTQQKQEDDTAAPEDGQQQIIDMTSRNRKVTEGTAAPVAPAPAPVAPVIPTRKRGLEGHTLPSSHHPETAVYNSAVERQFFDLAKEALSSYARDGGQAWAEFMKCLDMYAQEVLSRNDLLTLVEPLLGKRNAKLFEDFKRIISSAGSTSGPVTPLEDAWYSVPLSEIDFSRCRRCTLSYRALPRDYPAPPCTERSEAESKVLNDVWVSLPVGSEESYTFRHMRRNTYEEQLFRCEDERFEIDMVIDSNAATLQRLLPVAEEIARLSKSELVADDHGAKTLSEGAGIAGKRFQYTFDREILGVIHRNTIARIYGDAGHEILDLMVKNPVVTIPLVVERLRQKDKEWKKARNRLRVDWRKLAEANYYKSLDHRSLTWRTTDKRGTSTRTLVAEIKDRAQNRGKEGKEALRQKLEKAKEEHGLFFEVTMADTLTQDLDLTFLPKPDRLLFTPHLSVLYENNSWAQRDAYRILSFALERGTITPHDKERCHRLWSEFLGPWFGLTVGWMHAPAVSYQESAKKVTNGPVAASPAVISEEEEDDSLDDHADVGGRVVTEESNHNKTSDPSKSSDSLDMKDYHPLPVGCRVSTLYGEGAILEFRQSKRMYVVQLAFGKAYMRPSSILCSLLPAEKSNYTDQLRSEDRSRLVRPTDQLAIGTQSLFLVFRLHQIVIRRLNIAMSLAHSVGKDASLCTLVEQMPGLNPKAVARRRYDAYLALVYSVLDGGHVGEYEDRVRSLLGHGAYELATMDKLISHLWKNMQQVAQDEVMWNLIQLYRRHKDSGSFQPEAFRQEAAFLSEGEPMYAFQWCPIQGKDKGVLHFEYLGVIAEEDDDEDIMEEDDYADAEPVVESVHKRPRR